MFALATSIFLELKTAWSSVFITCSRVFPSSVGVFRDGASSTTSKLSARAEVISAALRVFIRDAF